MVRDTPPRPPVASGALRRDAGATAIEYGLILALVCLVLVAGVSVLSMRLSGTFAAAGEALTGQDTATEVVAAPPATAEPAGGQGRGGELAAAAAVGAAAALIVGTRPRARRRSRTGAGWL